MIQAINIMRTGERSSGRITMKRFGEFSISYYETIDIYFALNHYIILSRLLLADHRIYPPHVVFFNEIKKAM
jgi:hypothetical protein